MRQQIAWLKYQFAQLPHHELSRWHALLVVKVMEPYQHLYHQQHSYRALPCSQNIYYPSVSSQFANYASNLDSSHVGAPVPNFPWGYPAANPSVPTASGGCYANGGGGWRHAASPEVRGSTAPLVLAGARSSGSVAEGEQNSGSEGLSRTGGHSDPNGGGLKEEARTSPSSIAKVEDTDDGTIQSQGEAEIRFFWSNVDVKRGK